MSVWAVSWAYRQRVKPSGAKFALVTLAQFADGDGFCWPGQMRLAKLTGMGERTIREHLEALEGRRLIRSETRRRENGTYTTNGYWLLAPADALNPPSADFADGAEQGEYETGSPSVSGSDLRQNPPTAKPAGQELSIEVEDPSVTDKQPPSAVPATAGPAEANGEVIPIRNGRALQAATDTLARLKAEVDQGRRSWSLSEAATAEWLALLDDDHGLRGAQEFVMFYLAANTGRDVRSFAPAHWSMAGLRVRRWRGLVLHGVDEAITRIDPDEKDERGKIGQPFWAYVEKVCQSAHARNQEGSA